MKKNKSTQKYNDFHSSTSVQSKIINKNNFTYRNITSLIRKYVIGSNNKILDIGCGSGTISFFAASLGNLVMGIDVSDNAISACIKSSKRLNLSDKTQFKVTEFPDDYPAERYDFIFCFEVLEHLKKDKTALNKIFSLLKKDGVALISVPSKNAPLYKLGFANEFDRKVGHLRRYTDKELLKLCKNAGFKILEVKKTEGLVRNFLFLNKTAGRLVRFIRLFLSDLVSFFDFITIKLFGESDIFIVVQRK